MMYHYHLTLLSLGHAVTYVGHAVTPLYRHLRGSLLGFQPLPYRASKIYLVEAPTTSYKVAVHSIGSMAYRGVAKSRVARLL